jgi:DNA polymerase
LYLKATQAVFGEGPRTARMALVGEQPGNEEDIQGHPFVGLAGGILDRALADASIRRAEVYVPLNISNLKNVGSGGCIRRRALEKCAPASPGWRQKWK